MRVVRTLASLTILAVPVFGGFTAQPAEALPPIDPGIIVLPPILPTLPPIYFCNGEIATIVGTATDDVLIGTPGHDVVVAFGGNDQIWGGAGRDTICAGAGDDLISGELGRDYIDGQGGSDLVGYGVDPGPISANLMYNRVISAQGTDTVMRVESVYGTPYNDRIVGNRFTNLLWGSGGVDSIDGRAGDDGCDGETVARCEYGLVLS
jgi:Ca2+-binding RTX toxin-like protein